eukprot:g1889.t1
MISSSPMKDNFSATIALAVAAIILLLGAVLVRYGRFDYPFLGRKCFLVVHVAFFLSLAFALQASLFSLPGYQPAAHTLAFVVTVLVWTYASRAVALLAALATSSAFSKVTTNGHEVLKGGRHRATSIFKQISQHGQGISRWMLLSTMAYIKAILVLMILLGVCMTATALGCDKSKCLTQQPGLIVAFTVQVLSWAVLAIFLLRTYINKFQDDGLGIRRELVLVCFSSPFLWARYLLVWTGQSAAEDLWIGNLISAICLAFLALVSVVIPLTVRWYHLRRSVSKAPTGEFNNVLMKKDGLISFMSTEAGYTALRDFFASEFAAEHVFFVNDALQFKAAWRPEQWGRLSSQQQLRLVQFAKDIYTCYIDANSNSAVNVGHRDRNAVYNTLTELGLFGRLNIKNVLPTLQQSGATNCDPSQFAHGPTVIVQTTPPSQSRVMWAHTANAGRADEQKEGSLEVQDGEKGRSGGKKGNAGRADEQKGSLEVQDGKEGSSGEEKGSRWDQGDGCEWGGEEKTNVKEDGEEEEVGQYGQCVVEMEVKERGKEEEEEEEEKGYHAVGGKGKAVENDVSTGQQVISTHASDSDHRRGSMASQQHGRSDHQLGSMASQQHGRSDHQRGSMASQHGNSDHRSLDAVKLSDWTGSSPEEDIQWLDSDETKHIEQYEASSREVDIIDISSPEVVPEFGQVEIDRLYNVFDICLEETIMVLKGGLQRFLVSPMYLQRKFPPLSVSANKQKSSRRSKRTESLSISSPSYGPSSATQAEFSISEHNVITVSINNGYQSPSVNTPRTNCSTATATPRTSSGRPTPTSSRAQSRRSSISWSIPGLSAAWTPRDNNKSRRGSVDSTARDNKSRRGSVDSAARDNNKSRRGSVDSTARDNKARRGSVDSTAHKPRRGSLNYDGRVRLPGAADHRRRSMPTLGARLLSNNSPIILPLNERSAIITLEEDLVEVVAPWNSSQHATRKGQTGSASSPPLMAGATLATTANTATIATATASLPEPRPGQADTAAGLLDWHSPAQPAAGPGMKQKVLSCPLCNCQFTCHDPATFKAHAAACEGPVSVPASITAISSAAPTSVPASITSTSSAAPTSVPASITATSSAAPTAIPTITTRPTSSKQASLSGLACEGLASVPASITATSSADPTSVPASITATSSAAPTSVPASITATSSAAPTAIPTITTRPTSSKQASLSGFDIEPISPLPLLRAPAVPLSPASPNTLPLLRSHSANLSTELEAISGTTPELATSLSVPFFSPLMETAQLEAERDKSSHSLLATPSPNSRNSSHVMSMSPDCSMSRLKRHMQMSRDGRVGSSISPLASPCSPQRSSDAVIEAENIPYYHSNTRSRNSSRSKNSSAISVSLDMESAQTPVTPKTMSWTSPTSVLSRLVLSMPPSPMSNASNSNSNSKLQSSSSSSKIVNKKNDDDEEEEKEEKNDDNDFSGRILSVSPISNTSADVNNNVDFTSPSLSLASHAPPFTRLRRATLPTVSSVPLSTLASSGLSKSKPLFLPTVSSAPLSTLASSDLSKSKPLFLPRNESSFDASSSPSPPSTQV